MRCAVRIFPVVLELVEQFIGFLLEDPSDGDSEEILCWAKLPPHAILSMRSPLRQAICASCAFIKHGCEQAQGASRENLTWLQALVTACARVASLFASVDFESVAIEYVGFWSQLMRPELVDGFGKAMIYVAVNLPDMLASTDCAMEFMDGACGPAVLELLRRRLLAYSADPAATGMRADLSVLLDACSCLILDEALADMSRASGKPTFRSVAREKLQGTLEGIGNGHCEPRIEEQCNYILSML